MTNSIAVVQWTEGDKEKSESASNLHKLSQLIETMEENDYVYVVNLTRLDTIIPTSPYKPYTGDFTPSEYKDKVQASKTPHGAFREPTTIPQARVPPITIRG